MQRILTRRGTFVLAFVLFSGIGFASSWAETAPQTLSETETAETQVTDPALSPQAEWTAEERQALIKVSDYLNSIDTLKAHFTQIGSDGSFGEGTLYISRPGRARFDYLPPNNLSVIANGLWLAMWDKDIDYVDRIPLWDTPMSVLLEEKSNLSQPHERLGVEDIYSGQGVIRLTVYDKDNPEQGTLTLVFEDKPMILRRWDALDSVGQRTSVSISDIETGLPLPRKVFALPDL